MPESSQPPVNGGDLTRGALHPLAGSRDSVPPAAPQTGLPAAEIDGGRERMRVLAVNLDVRKNPEIYNRLRDLSWQAARYRNLFIRALWCESKGLCVDPSKGPVPHDVTKWIRADEKNELGSEVTAAIESEAFSLWRKHAKRVFAGAALPESKPTAALMVRSRHNGKNPSGVRLTCDENDRYQIHLQLLGKQTGGECWITVPLDVGTAKDYQADMLDRMVEGEVEIKTASIKILPMRHEIVVRMSYPVTIGLPQFGNRKATLGPIKQGSRIWLRTECDTRDFSGKLYTLLKRKTDWDATRRRVMAQIGRRKGGARLKRQKLSQMTWQGWLDNYLHTWSREIIDWLKGQGVGNLSVIGLENVDWPAFKFRSMLQYKGELEGIAVTTEVDLAAPGTERAVKSEIQKRRRKATKAADALRELASQVG